jgi:NAD(P)-dependent dehydrogenase (short-subunit alcohol dehydrogenase family)
VRNKNTMKILVTGGLGGVGRPLVQRLLSHGHAVRVLDRVSEPCPEGVECVAGDVTDFAAVREAMRGMNAAVHLAALTYPAAGPGHEIFRLNCGGTYNVYEAAAQEGIRRVVSASSINALGFNFGVKSFPIQYLPMDEAHPTYTTDAYSFSKQTVEAIAAYYWRRDGISGTQLRMPFVYSALGDFVEMVKKFMRQSRQAFQDFAMWPEEQQRAKAAQVMAKQEESRAQRLSEKPWEENDDPNWFEKMDPLLMIFSGFTDFWAILSGEDAAQAFEKSLTAEYEGSHPLYVSERENSLGFPSGTLAKLFFPGAALTRPLAGAESLVSFARAARVIGFAPERKISDWLQDQG